MKKHILTISLCILIILACGVYVFFGFHILHPVIKLQTDFEYAAKHPRLPGELQRLRQEGLPTSLADITRKAPVEFQNAALVYRELEKYPDDPDELEAYKRMFHPLNPANIAYLKEFVRTHSRIINLAHKAVSRPDYYVYYDLNTDPASIKFPEFKQARRTTRLITVESMSMLQGNNGVPAVKNMALGFQPGKHMAKEFSLIAYLVANACNAITYRGLQSILTATHGDAATARSVKQLFSHYMPQSLSDVFKGELAFQLSEIEYLRKQGPGALDNGYGILHFDHSYNAKQWNGMIDLNGVYIINTFRPAIQYADMPYPDAHKELKPVDDAVDKASGLKTFIAVILVPKSSRTIVKRAEDIANAAITYTAADVFIYKAKHGAFPDRLEQATGQSLKDPFDLKPLKYKREGKGFVIYSVGETGKYDGRYLKNNTTIIPATKPGEYSLNSHEIVYRYTGE